MPEAFTDQSARHFPTVVFSRTYGDSNSLNAALAALIRQIRDTEPNAAPGSSTRGGYQTDTNFLYRQDAPVKSLQTMLHQAVQTYLPQLFQGDLVETPKNVEARLWGWAVIMRAGDYNAPHVHPDAHVSGVYYPEVPTPSPDDESESESEPAGSLILYDPRPGATMHPLKGHRTHHAFVPTSGSLVMFPSYLMHGVHAYRGPSERISIAFNARLTLS